MITVAAVVAGWKAWGWLVKWVALGLAVAGLLWGAYSWAYGRGFDSRDKEVTKLSDEITAIHAKARAQYDQAQADARAKESQHRAALALIAETYEKEKRDAQAHADRVAADLRAGALRLRREWQGCQAAASGGVPGAAAGPEVADGDAELRGNGAANLVSAARLCDTQIKGLQQVIRQLQGEP